MSSRPEAVADSGLVGPYSSVSEPPKCEPRGS